MYQHFPYDDAGDIVVVVFQSAVSENGDAHLRLEWSLPLFCKPP